MDFKTFTSQNGWFSMTLPTDWEEYDDEAEGTYAFFNSKSWTGNFRVTPIRWTKENVQRDKPFHRIEKELKENKGAVKIKLGDFECVHYKKDIKQDNDSLLIYYWTTGQKNIMFVCSFTIDKEQEQTKLTESELQVVQDMIKSIRLN